MKFRVTGSNKDTGARMILEMEAESRAAAERKAMASGMVVNHVLDISDGPVAHASSPNPAAGRMRRSGSGVGGRLLLLILLAAAVAAAWYFWPQVRRLLNP